QVFADGAAVWPKALREFFINDGYLLFFRRIIFAEESAHAQRNLHRPKIIPACDSYVRLQFLPRRWRVAFHIDTSPTHRTRERQPRNGTLGHNSQKMSNTALDFLIELDH